MRQWNNPHNEFKDLLAKVELGLVNWWDLEDDLLEEHLDALVISLSEREERCQLLIKGLSIKPKSAGYLSDHNLLKYSKDSDIAKKEIINRIKKNGEVSYGYRDADPHVDVQRTIVEHTNWLSYKRILSDEVKKEAFEKQEKELARSLRDCDGYWSAHWVEEELEHIPIGSSILTEYFHILAKCRSSYNKSKIQKIMERMDVKTLEAEWPKLSDATRGNLLDRGDLPDKLRECCLRIVLRSPSLKNYELRNSRLPWNVVRKMPIDYLHGVPNFVCHNKENLTGDPISLDEFKKMLFSRIIKQDKKAEEAVYDYDKLHIAADESAKLQNFFIEMEKKAKRGIKKWMEDCGTESAKNIAFTFKTEFLTAKTSSEQAELKRMIDAEPKKIEDYFEEEDTNV